MHFTMKLSWAVPTKHVRAIHLRGNYPSDLLFKGFFLYDSGESLEVDAAIACCIKNYQGDATNPDRIMYTPTVNYSVQIGGDTLLDSYGKGTLKAIVLDSWIDDRVDYERALDMLNGDLPISEFFA